MAKAIDLLTKQFKGLGRRSLEMPEMTDNGNPTYKIYWKPWTLEEKKGLNSYLDLDDLDMFIKVLVLKAQDEKGAALFDRGDVPKLKLHCHDAVIRKMGAMILADNNKSVSIEDAEGN